ncbi:MAG TPA: hypothetical protein PK400_08045 [Phycisphaerales bacterium]|nr:hypothetical protein [Phycisphaerales bacterium]HRQ76382.1 hypothetical protein [Phycisphaerales bacterium]
MNTLARVRALLDQLLECYEATGGRSVDDYDDEARVHPMAEGKYISTLVQMRHSRLISEHRYLAAARQTLVRLESANVAQSPKEAAWGLGFSYRDAPAEEPYVITTAIIAHGLMDLPHQESGHLASRAVRWLTESAPKQTIDFRGKSLEFPLFSPHIPELIINVAAVATSVLHRASLLHHVAERAAWIESLYVRPVGWPYATDNLRVDLLHQCYILNALADLSGVLAVEEATIRLLGIFRSGTGFKDRMTILSKDELHNLANHASTDWFFELADDQWVLRHMDRARDWSLGELLVLVSRLEQGGRYRSLWRGAVRSILEMVAPILESDLNNTSRQRFRHSIHLAHGVAWALRCLRSPHHPQVTPT